MADEQLTDADLEYLNRIADQVDGLTFGQARERLGMNRYHAARVLGAGLKNGILDQGVELGPDPADPESPRGTRDVLRRFRD